MRSPLLLSLLLALPVVTIGACEQSLTPHMTGTGGTGTGAGATGGITSGTGGSGGNNVGALCNTLSSEYQSALTAAEGCQVGASGQCQQLVSSALSGCTCSTYVTDSSALTTIQKAWQASGCAGGTEPPCALFCPVALNTICVPTDGGSVGFCSYAPGTGGTSGAGGATGGATGAGGSAVDGGLSLCGTLASEYAAVIIGAKDCTAGTAGQCAQPVPASLSPCQSCTDFVNDSSVLDAIRQKWTAAGCADVRVLCPLIACLPPTGAMCVASDAGSSVCSTSYQPILSD